MTPLLPTPPSAALRIEGKQQAFFGFFEAVPGIIELVNPVNKITIVNAFSQRTTTRLEGVGLKGGWQAYVYDQTWQPIGKTSLKTDASGGLNINFAGPTGCHAVVLNEEVVKLVVRNGLPFAPRGNKLSRSATTLVEKARGLYPQLRSIYFRRNHEAKATYNGFAEILEPEATGSGRGLES